jgi:hypothetical protein
MLHKILIAFSDLKETCVEQSGFYGFDLTYCVHASSRLAKLRQQNLPLCRGCVQYVRNSCIKTKEMADYTTMKSYLEKNDLQYFTF